jgi:glycogen synthase
MRILVITNYYPPVELGGWEQLTRDVVDRLSTRDHRIVILTSDYKKSTISETSSNIHRVLHLESSDPFHYHPITSILSGRQERENIAYLERTVLEFCPEIIFINGMWNLPVSIAKNAERLLPNRVIYYMASYWPTEVDAHTAYWSSPAESHITRYLKQLVGDNIKRSFLNGSPRNQLEFRMVLCVSKYVQDIMMSQAGIPLDRTRIVHNGIDINLFKGKLGSLLGKQIRLLYAGRLAPEKGVHTIIESLAMLRNDSNLPGYKLSIYGHGNQEYEHRLHNLIADNQLSGWVTFKGLVPHETMPDILAQNDILVFPSIWAEPLARIVQEAMACGLVVVGTHTGGTSEILKDGENGLVFEAENSTMLADKIKLLSRDPALRQRLALAARHTVEVGFSLETMVDQIEAAFREIVIS